MAIPIFSILAAAGTAIANGVATHRANKVNQKNYEEVRRYNTPGAQMSRFRAANLNPNLIYTQSNEADQRPEWKAPQYDFSALANAPSELSSYQNIKESKARVNNLEKQNQLLTSQIIGQNIENYWSGRIKPVELKKLYKDIKLVDKQAENIDFEQALKNRQLFWDIAYKYATLGLDKQRYDLAVKQFNEMKRQFELTHKGSSILDAFLKELTGNTGSSATSIVGKLLAQWLMSNFGS